MTNQPNKKIDVAETYQKRAPGYNLVIKLFDAFSWLGFNITGWRKQAIAQLNLQPGDTVVDIGCGTGLNFSLLYDAVGPSGSIIGVDLSEAMLAEAQNTASANYWENVTLVCADACQYEFPARVNAVLSTYALTLVPDPALVVTNAVKTLAPGGRLVILDMAWPKYCPLWWRHILFFLKSYGVTKEILHRKPWLLVQKTMERWLANVEKKGFWFGFFYLAVGEKT
jgi:demethylmenaquinone methyltransferase/2-methoxy-6-polyprenyl-1,4-benzoquinol methylase